MKKPERWYWSNQYGHGLTKKARVYLSYKAKHRKIKKIVQELRNWRVMFKTDYDSDRGSSHDVYVEATIYVQAYNENDALANAREKLYEIFSENLPIDSEDVEQVPKKYKRGFIRWRYNRNLNWREEIV